MNIVSDRKDLVRFARRARARLGLVRAVETALRAAFWAVLLALTGILVARLFALPLLWQPAGAALAAGVIMAAALSAFLPRRSLLEAAAAVDDRAGWKERLSSALALPAPAHPMELALVEDVRVRLRGRSVSRDFPFRAPRELRWTLPAAGALAAACFLVPPLDLLGLAARAEEQRKEREAVQIAAEKLEKRVRHLEKDGRSLDRVKQAVQKMDALQAELSKTPPPERQEAMAMASKVADEIKKMQEELSRSAALAEKLQKAAAEKGGGDAGELGRLLREGKLDEAAQTLARMRNALQEGKLSPAEREKLRKQMEALQERLAKDPALSDLEKRLSRAMQGLGESDEQKLDDLQQALSRLDGDLSESDQLAQALQDLESLTDALAKDQHRCPSCGQKSDGQGGCMGKGGEGCPGGLGRGKGQGDSWEEGQGESEGGAFGQRGQGSGGEAPETPSDFSTEKTKVNSKLGKGTYMGAYFMKGEPPKGAAGVEYAEVEKAYAEEALDALQKQKVPAAQKDFVRDYFDAIRAREAAPKK
jgi:hypothetical protein